MIRKAIVISVLTGGLVWSATAVAGQDLAYFAEGNRTPAVVNLSVADPLEAVNLDEQRGVGASIPMPSAGVPSTGPVAVILWDEVSKGRTQNSGANIGVGIQSSNVRN